MRGHNSTQVPVGPSNYWEIRMRGQGRRNVKLATPPPPRLRPASGRGAARPFYHLPQGFIQRGVTGRRRLQTSCRIRGRAAGAAHCGPDDAVSHSVCARPYAHSPKTRRNVATQRDAGYLTAHARGALHLHSPRDTSISIRDVDSRQ
jgi:hypothetical protein